MLMKKKISIGLVGLGYVGLPLAIEFAKKYNVIGYDKNKKRIFELKNKHDSNFDIERNEFYKIKDINFTINYKDLNECNVYIITVPTPVNKLNKPDLRFIKQACKDIGSILNINDVVIFESTVYPGLTEEFCVPIIEKHSKLIFNKEFFCGYSPERINPSDKIHKLTKIIKITSGSNKKTLTFVDNLYKSIIKAGTYKVKSIKIAEAAKVIENSQRDLNIAFVNELAQIFDKLEINTKDVLNAASTKWNFLNFTPGLVGGHCIGVDPYYLTYKSKSLGYTPKIITAGREINDKFTNYIIDKAIKFTKKNFNKTKKIKFLILGLTFKENCADFRNSKSIELVNKLKQMKFEVHAYDPIVDINEFNKNNNIKVLKKINANDYHCCIITVAHNHFKKLGDKNIRKYLLKNGLIFDVKNILPQNDKNIYL